MKFNEKLIELRKKQGLSQEELGYKLDVTRQTVSKWELGQTTPEMDKLVEMSKLFNVSVDDLINDAEIPSANPEPIIENQPIGNTSEKKNKFVPIIVVALIIVIVMIVVKLFSGFAALNTVNKVVDSATGNSGNFIERFFNMFERIMGNAIDAQEKVLDKMDENDNEQNKTDFNEIIDNAIDAQDKIHDKMDENDNEQNKTDFNEIIDNAIDNIQDTNNEMDIIEFNSILEMYSGTKMGSQVVTLLDNVVTKNKTEERKITVKYLETETQDETEIKNIKRKLETFTNYDVSLDYDADGFVNKVTIEKF